MFTFTLKDGKVLEKMGAPDIIIRSEDYPAFLNNRSIFEKQFPDCIFGCVQSVDAEYELNEENRIHTDDEDISKVGVYFGICNKQ